MDTKVLHPDASSLARAAAILRAGGLVAMPTETVYGLAGDARSNAAVAAIYAAKGRPAFNPLIVHVADLSQVGAIALLDDRARALAAAFWPGPLTLVLPLRADAGLAAGVTAGLGTVAVRAPAHATAQALLAAFGGPLAAPSANLSGQVSPTRAAHVMDGLGGRIDAILDGGACIVGVESTIIGLDGPATLLRPGGIPLEAIEALLGGALVRPADAAMLSAPGQLPSHYAPAARVVLDAVNAPAGTVLVGFGPGACDLTLSAAGDLAEAAAALFHTLRAADEAAGPGGTIMVAPIPAHGLGAAINDRLRRAAAPRTLSRDG